MARKRRPQARRARRPRAKTSQSISINIARPTPAGKRLDKSQLSVRNAAARDRSANAIGAMRRDPNLRLTQAAKLFRVKIATIQNYFPSALRKVNGRFQVRTSHGRSLTIYLPDEHGDPVPLDSPSRRERKQAGDYLRDVGRFLGGNKNALSKWRGKKIAGVDLVTEGRTLVAIEPALSEFSLYRALNGGAM